MLRNFGPGEIILIVVVVLVLFGAGFAKKLPDAASSVGRSLRIFKREMKEMRSDDASQHDRAADPSAQVPPSLPAGQQVPAGQQPTGQQPTAEHSAGDGR